MCAWSDVGITQLEAEGLIVDLLGVIAQDDSEDSFALAARCLVIIDGLFPAQSLLMRKMALCTRARRMRHRPAPDSRVAQVDRGVAVCQSTLVRCAHRRARD